MGHILTVELSDSAFAALSHQAQAVATSPNELAAAALEQRFIATEELPLRTCPTSEADQRASRERFERHFGAVNLGYATGADNEGIDAELARAYSDNNEAG